MRQFNNCILLLLVIFLAMCTHKDGTCEQPEKVNFRGFKFEFPIRGYDVMSLEGLTKQMQYERILIDSIQKGTSACWYTEHSDNKYRQSDSVKFMKEAYIYGVSFMLWNERDKDDSEILAELYKSYPGEYKLWNQNGRQYYLNHQKCMSVIFRRDFLDKNRPVPVVSFCYGLSQQNEHYYGQSTGSNTFPD